MISVGTGSATVSVQSNGNHDLILKTGNSDTGNIQITDGANGNIDITPHGTGEVNISKVDIDAGTIDGTDVTVGSGKTLDVSSGTLTTSTSQKQAITDGSNIEGTDILSTGETGGEKFLREDGDGTCSWQAITGIPAGLIAPFGFSSEPSGWLICDGRAVSRTTYSALFSAISTTWGTGDGSTTFNLPDFEGAFLRGTGTNATHTKSGGGYFAGPSVGSYENDSFQDHEHTQTGQAGNAGPYANGTYPGTPATTNVVAGDEGSPRNTSGETKPFNAGVNYCIKT